MKRRIFVFGSNVDGFHGGGAARDAMTYWGAILGQAVGLQGDSYAIPTKNLKSKKPIRNVPFNSIAKHVEDFLLFATAHPELQFHVTAIGTGLAGWRVDEIAPMFRNVPDNVFVCDDFYLFNLNQLRHVSANQII